MASAPTASVVKAVNSASCFPAQTTAVILLWSLFATSIMSLLTPWYVWAQKFLGAKTLTSIYLWQIETCDLDTLTCATQNVVQNGNGYPNTTIYNAGVVGLTLMITCVVLTFAIAVVGSLLPSGRVGDAKKAGHAIYNGLWLVSVFSIIAWATWAGLYVGSTPADQVTYRNDENNYARFGGGFAGAVIVTALAPITAAVFAAAQKEVAPSAEAEKPAPAVAAA